MTQAVGGGAALRLAAGGDQPGDVALIEGAAELRGRSRGTQGWRELQCGKAAGQRLAWSASKRQAPPPQGSNCAPDQGICVGSA